MYRTNFLDEPARPGPTRPWRSLTGYFSNILNYTNLKLLHNIVTGPKNVVVNFDRDILFNFEVITFLRRRIFAIFTYILAYNS